MPYSSLTILLQEFFELPTGNLHLSTNLWPVTSTYIVLPCARKKTCCQSLPCAPLSSLVILLLQAFFWATYRESPFVNKPAASNFDLYLSAMCKKHQAIWEHLQGKWLTISCVIPRLLSTFQSLAKKHLCALFWSLSNFIFMEHFKVIIFEKKASK